MSSDDGRVYSPRAIEAIKLEVLRTAADLCTKRAKELDKWGKVSADKEARNYRLMSKEILLLKGKV
jgi:hypothetical protein